MILSGSALILVVMAWFITLGVLALLSIIAMVTVVAIGAATTARPSPRVWVVQAVRQVAPRCIDAAAHSPPTRIDRP